MIQKAEFKDVLAGYASLSRYRDRKAFHSAVEISIYIHGKHRGRGVGRKLMEETIGFSYCGQLWNAGVKFGKQLNLNAYQIIYDREKRKESRELQCRDTMYSP